MYIYLLNSTQSPIRTQLCDREVLAHPVPITRSATPPTPHHLYVTPGARRAASSSRPRPQGLERPDANGLNKAVYVFWSYASITVNL